ncbi:hypothetical protein [Vreelandella titanicae]|uniref:hypothetical protein n=1 Tax=Vreelandella titanicae TaxID=664683 RepID=UPI00241EBE55|nr:hypothetical protein [Halomonas titanicae]
MSTKKAGVWRIKNGKKTCIQEPTKPPKRLKPEAEFQESTPPADVPAAKPQPQEVNEDDPTT